jgi:hypothetical protein
MSLKIGDPVQLVDNSGKVGTEIFTVSRIGEEGGIFVKGSWTEYPSDKVVPAASQVETEPALSSAAVVPVDPTTAAEDIAELRASLEYLKTSSNANAGGTIVYIAIQRFEAAIAKL